MKQPFKWIGGNDLSYQTDCNCQDPKWADNKETGHLFKTKIRLTGYSDNYFFDEANKEPKQDSCRVCHRKYIYQWFRDGINFEFIEGKE